ncbi:DUF6498-containing protein [Halorussus amylolyticus]|uniref:DUF6498-containing protein n=1 Tax=Halorussus amylolyticus TaxID=1126242 RepID=UPI001053AB6F|nr:DUF6498-containing protein [Halorussus amylolyticus]
MATPEAQSSRRESRASGRTTARLLLVANLVPLAGLAVFGWRLTHALFVYWVELGLALVLYFGVVLFAQRESKPDQKRGGSYPGPIPFPRRSGSIRPVSWLPPIRYRNARYVPAASVIVTVIWLLSSRAFLEYPNFDVALGARAYAGEYVAYVVAAYSPEGLALAVVLFGVRLRFVSRDFFRRGLVERYSAAMLMEIPCRVALFWFGVLVALAPVALLVAATGAYPAIAGGLIAAIVVVSKLATDRALVRIRYRNDPGWFARLFAPNRREAEHGSETDRTVGARPRG